jgi:hypothetical protein
VDGLSMCASDEGGESGGPAVRVQLALRTMTGGPFRRLQELAAVLRGWFVNVCERRRRRIWRAGCQSAIGRRRIWRAGCQSAIGTASRAIGHDMQRGPPRPEPSSDPAMGITSMPASARRWFVSTFRS